MPKLSLKEKQIQNEKQARYERGYKDYLYLLLATAVCLLLESPAIIGLLMSESRNHFNTYGVFMIVASVGFLISVLLLALDKRKASIIVSVASGLFIVLTCTLIYAGYESALNTTEMNALQIIISYAIPAISVPTLNIIMVNRRI